MSTTTSFPQPSKQELETLGRKRLSHSFYMRDFLYSETAVLSAVDKGIVNYPTNPALALKTGKKLCEELLEPLQTKFGRLNIRSAYRAEAVNDYCQSQKSWGCAESYKNYGRHIWDKKADDVGEGAMACIVIPQIADIFAKDKTIWKELAWWIHDNLPYSELEFFSKLCAFNIGWAQRPAKRITSWLEKPRLLTELGMANHEGSHHKLYPRLISTNSNMKAQANG